MLRRAHNIVVAKKQRVNEDISGDTIRLVDESGGQLGIVSVSEAKEVQGGRSCRGKVVGLHTGKIAAEQGAVAEDDCGCALALEFLVDGSGVVGAVNRADKQTVHTPCQQVGSPVLTNGKAHSSEHVVLGSRGSVQFTRPLAGATGKLTQGDPVQSEGRAQPVFVAVGAGVGAGPA